MHTHTYARTHAHTDTCTHTHTNTYTHARTYTHTHTRAHAHTHTYTQVNVSFTLQRHFKTLQQLTVSLYTRSKTQSSGQITRKRQSPPCRTLYIHAVGPVSIFKQLQE